MTLIEYIVTKAREREEFEIARQLDELSVACEMLHSILQPVMASVRADELEAQLDSVEIKQPEIATITAESNPEIWAMLQPPAVK